MPGPTSFTGRTRRRQTNWTVRFVDRIARGLIAAGGIGTIAAVFLVCFFLLSVVFPLFQGGKISEPTQLAAAWKSLPPVQVGIDEYRELGWALLPDGKVQVFRMSDGQLLEEVNPFRTTDAEVPDLTAWAFSTRGDEAAFGFSDGSVRVGRIGFEANYVDAADIGEAFRDLEIGAIGVSQGTVANRLSQSQFRLQKLVTELGEPTPSASKSAIVLIDYFQRSSGPIFCTLSADGTIHVNSVRQRENLLTGEITSTVRSNSLPLPETSEKASHLLLSGLGDMVYVAWNDGRLIRYDIRDLDGPRQVEELDLIADFDVKLTSLCFLLGRSTLIVGDSSGQLGAWFPVRSEDAETEDGWSLTKAHQLPGHSAPVTSLAASPRSRLVAAGYEDGVMQLIYVTSDQLVLQSEAPTGSPIQSLVVAPKSDAVLAATAEGLTWWNFDVGHPEVSARTLFRPVWYEGYSNPDHVWQTSSGQDAAEAKLGLWPLVFGTLKATFYSMLFGAPLALLAALYTSEFLQPRFKARIKPTIEMMASLPSVVLGFLAGLVIAPMVEGIIPQLITTIYVLPLVVLTGAYLWQLLPPKTGIRLSKFRFFVILLLAIPAGVAAGWVLGPLVERLLFAGDLRAWLDGQIGTAVGGWMLLFIPLSGVAAAFFMARTVNPWIRNISAGWTRTQSAAADFLKFVLSVVLTVGLALAISFLLTSLRFDPRGGYVDTYVQRNAMIVGFIMGFAIIPIIYTIADDALTSVPEHLRSASLGAGATPWQTATRIVIPTAMSGLFSAVMIGLGRAVGETMIVLMAAGNTSILEWNIFNGFQTLSAAIATELPEAPPGDTHYRVLFLAALTLFIMTFAVNTVAEMVRLRFRRRAYEL